MSTAKTSSHLRRRVLIGAYALSPYRGSEPGIGWNVVSRLAQYHDVTVLAAPSVPGSSSDDFRGDCQRYLQQHGPIPGLTLHWIEPPLLSRWLQRESLLCRRSFYYAGYAAWQRRALAVARQLHAQQPFDLVHHLNITGYREPGYLWKLDVPFVWGPIAGAPNLPWRYFDLLSGKEKLFYAARNLTNAWQQHSRRCRLAATAARHIWAVSAADAELVRRWGGHAERLRDSAAAPNPQAALRNYDGHRPLRLVWSGQHIGRKALPILLHALARFAGARHRFELTVLGDGPERRHWQKLAHSLRLLNITWLGWVPREQALAQVARADVLPFTSLLEGTPQALLEAMSLGVPVICHDACGMGTAVTDACGLRVPLHDSGQSIHGFAAALARLADDPMLLQRLSAGAIARTAELSWDNQAARMAAVYDAITAGQSLPQNTAPPLRPPDQTTGVAA